MNLTVQMVAERRAVEARRKTGWKQDKGAGQGLGGFGRPPVSKGPPVAAVVPPENITPPVIEG